MIELRVQSRQRHVGEEGRAPTFNLASDNSRKRQRSFTLRKSFNRQLDK